METRENQGGKEKQRGRGRSVEMLALATGGPPRPLGLHSPLSLKGERGRQGEKGWTERLWRGGQVAAGW